MPHSQSYPVTVPVSLPQPHVDYAVKSSGGMQCSGWLPFATAGILSVCFLVCVHLLGGSVIFLQIVDRYSELVPIIKKGSLEVYPLIPGTNDGIQTTYFTHLPPANLAGVVKTLNTLLNSYPMHMGNENNNCWLENPSDEKPCFFDSSWVAEVCSENNSYGYEESDGYYNPCFILKLDKTDDWTPISKSREDVPASVIDHYDPGFMPVDCFAKDIRASNQVLNITVYPAKGFSLLYFPASRFNSNKYLAPLVAIKVNSIQKRTNVTVECSVITPNAFLLWNNGKVVIDIASS